jgi:hypothetical protein
VAVFGQVVPRQRRDHFTDDSGIETYSKGQEGLRLRQNPVSTS